ncbi:MAG: hypothetical protein KKE76_09150 [Gammaproteobacteria bacterium]|nr:hypothetical protein [Gammaproteobacteria bacterium]
MYLFEASLSATDGSIGEYLVIFSGQLEGDGRDYANIFEKQFRGFLKPDAILFVYPQYLSHVINDFWYEDNPFFQNITRYGENIPVYATSFGPFGELKLEKEHNAGEQSIDLCAASVSIVEAGLYCLAKASRDEVILEAPPGTIFSKPSGEASEEFIKASGLARNYSQQQFVAYCLLTKRPRADIREILIDTAGIALFADAVCYYISRFSGDICKRVRYESFGSYGGIEKCKVDNPESIWVIISASHNNSLYASLVDKWSLPLDHAVTILTFTDKHRRLVNISALSRHIHAKEKNGSAVKVQIMGENFTAEVSEPKRVVIKKTAKPALLERVLKDFYDKGVFKCNKVVMGAVKPKPIYFEFNEAVAEHPGFKAWLERVVTWYLPRELEWIVVGDDSASQLLFNAFKDMLGKLSIDAASMKADFRSAGNRITGDKAVVVLVPVISSGRTLLDLNREMRLSGHKGNRIFIVPFGFPATDQEYETFKKSVLLGPENFKYQLFNYCHIAIGNSDQESSWELEERLVGRFAGISSLFRARLDRLEKQGEGLEGFIGCAPSNAIQKLSFSRDFAFWDGWGANHEHADHEAVYVTISAILQSLRQKEGLDGEDSLRSHVYQNAVIDPENFARFNDSLLQSCLWRAANSTELDYRRSDDLSYAMTSIIYRLIDDLSSKKSESAIDLLIGIATGKISLSKKALLDLVEKAKPKFRGNKDAIYLLNYVKTCYVNKPKVKKGGPRT